jgi:hypothetical protein
MGATALADLEEPADDIHASSAVASSQPAIRVESPPAGPTEAEVAPQPAVAEALTPIEKLRNGVLQALSDGNQRILVSMLDAGEWSVEGNEVVIRVSESQTVVDMSLSSDARRVAVAAASGVLGRAVRLKIVPGATVASGEKRNGETPRANGSGPGGRGRAEQDAVVRRLREKFGAEIRTVIDYKERR